MNNYTEYALQLIEVDKEIIRLQNKQARTARILNAQHFAHEMLCNRIKIIIRDAFRYINSCYIKLIISTCDSKIYINTVITADESKVSKKCITKSINLDSNGGKIIINISEKDMNIFKITESELDGSVDRIVKDLQELLYIGYKKEIAN